MSFALLYNNTYRRCDSAATSSLKVAGLLHLQATSQKQVSMQNNVQNLDYD